MEFAHEKGLLFDKVKDFAQMKELVLLEGFKKCLPERVIVYLNTLKVESWLMSLPLHTRLFFHPQCDTMVILVRGGHLSPQPHGGMW